MTDLPAPGAAADPSAQALADALPEIRSTKTKGWALCALAAAVSALALILLSGVEGSFQGVIIVLFMGGFALVSIQGLSELVKRIAALRGIEDPATAHLAEYHRPEQ